MKILVDGRKLGRTPSGIGMYINNFVEELDKSKKIEICLVTDVIESEEIKILKKNIKIYSFGKVIDKNLDVYKYFLYIQKIINEVKPDFFWEPNNIIPIFLKNKYGKIITTIHDIFPITSKENYNFIYKIYFKICTYITLMSSNALVYVSKDTKNQVETKFKKAKSIKSFISYNIVKVDKSDTINDGDYFLYIGNIESRKGVDILIKAFEQYKKNGGTKELYIAGECRDNLIKYKMDSSKYKNYINYLGYIDSEQKKKLLSECSAFVFPSRAEGFGIPPIEAIGYNKPCILSNLNIFKEIVGNSVNYFEFINENYEDSVNNLENVMHNFKVISQQDREGILYTYSAQNLGRSFINFLNEQYNK